VLAAGNATEHKKEVFFFFQSTSLSLSVSKRILTIGHGILAGGSGRS
jgi:hypothetical protein